MPFNFFMASFITLPKSLGPAGKILSTASWTIFFHEHGIKLGAQIILQNFKLFLFFSYQLGTITFEIYFDGFLSFLDFPPQDFRQIVVGKIGVFPVPFLFNFPIMGTERKRRKVLTFVSFFILLRLNQLFARLVFQVIHHYFFWIRPYFFDLAISSFFFIR